MIFPASLKKRVKRIYKLMPFSHGSRQKLQNYPLIPPSAVHFRMSDPYRVIVPTEAI